MIRKVATIRNRYGIHCRPSALIVKEMQDYRGTVRIVAASGEADARSVFGLISLGLEPGAECSIEVEGPDEQQICRQLVELFEKEFDFTRDSDPVTPE
jgi:phosphotransferase system HPr (HPr) family protein